MPFIHENLLVIPDNEIVLVGSQEENHFVLPADPNALDILSKYYQWIAEGLYDGHKADQTTT